MIFLVYYYSILHLVMLKALKHWQNCQVSCCTWRGLVWLTCACLGEQGKNNVAFACWLQLGRAQECLDLLIKTERFPEAAIFARTYLPSRVAQTTKLWRAHLEAIGKTKLAQAITDPEQDPEFFPEHKDVS
jgi:hypothetical protein